MPDPDPEDKLGMDWYGVPPPSEGLYHVDYSPNNCRACEAILLHEFT